jgi:hypothetical protein
VLVVAAATYRFVAPVLGPDGGSTPGLGPPVAATFGALSALVAYGDWRAVSFARMRELFETTVRGTVIGLTGLLFGGLVASLVTLLLRAFDAGFTVVTVVNTTAFGVGLGAVAVGALVAQGDDSSYLDTARPDVRDLGYAVVGILGMLFVLWLISTSYDAFGIESAQSTIEQQAREMANPVFLLALIPLSWLVIGPAEELVFRNIVQKSFYDTFSPAGAIGVSSLIFTVVHVPQYGSNAPNAVVLLSTLASIFVLSLLLGIIYYRTENLIVSSFVHGSFNAVQFLALYLSLSNTTSLLAG